MNIHETLVKLRVMLHEAEVDASLGNLLEADKRIDEIRKMLDRYDAGAPLISGGETDENPNERLPSRCLSCEYAAINSHVFPCNVCIPVGGKWSKWERVKIVTEEDPEETKVPPEELKNCSNCKFENYDAAGIPCDVCHQIVGGGFEKWESKQSLNEAVADLAEGGMVDFQLGEPKKEEDPKEMKVLPEKKTCSTCEHDGTGDEECISCFSIADHYEKWEPKQ